MTDLKMLGEKLKEKGQSDEVILEVAETLIKAATVNMYSYALTFLESDLDELAGLKDNQEELQKKVEELYEKRSGTTFKVAVNNELSKLIDEYLLKLGQQKE